MNHKEKAVNYFSQKLHCSQAVLAAFAEECGITASKIIDKAVEAITGIKGISNPYQNYSVSSPYGNVLFCAVIDGNEDRVIHFVKEVPTLASHPEETADVSELLHKLLKEFIR